MSDRISDILISINAATVEWIFLLLIPAALVAAFVYFDALNLMRLSRDLKRVSEAVQSIPHQDAPERMRNAEEVFSRPMHEAIRNAWGISLVNPPENVPPVAVKDLRTTFGISSVINLSTRRRLAELVPAGLFVIGLMGAGLDLLLTSARMNIGVQYAGMDEVFRSILPTLTSMVLMAAFCMILWFAVDRMILQWTVHRLAQLRDTMSARLPVLDEAELLRILLHDQREVANSLESLSTYLPDNIREVLRDDFAPLMFEAYRDTLENQLAPSIESLGRSVEFFAEKSLKNQTEGMRLLADRFFKRLEDLFADRFQTFDANLNRLFDLQNKTTEGMNGLVTEVTEAIHLQETVNQETRQTTEALDQSREHLSESTGMYKETLDKTAEIAGIMGQVLEEDRQMVERLQEEQSRLHDAQEKLQEFNNEYLQTLAQQTADMHSSMQTIGEGYLDSMHKQMGSMLDNLYASVDDIFSRFNEVSSTTFESIENRSNNMLEALTNTTREVMDQMREQTSDLGFFTREVNAEVSSLNDTLHQATTQYGEQMRLTLEGTFQSFDAGVAELTKRLSDTTERIRDAVDELPSAVAALKDGLKQDSGSGHGN